MTDPDERTINRAIAELGISWLDADQIQDLREEARAALHRLFRDRRRLEKEVSRIQSELKRLEEELEDARQYTDAEFEAMREGEEKALARLLMDLPGPEHTVTALQAELKRLEEVERWNKGECTCEHPLKGFIPDKGFRCRMCNKPLGMWGAQREWERHTRFAIEQQRNAEAELRRLREENERLQGKWDKNEDRCPQCGTGIDGHRSVARLRKIEEAAKQALRTLGAANGSRQLASDVLRNALKETEGSRDPGPIETERL